MCTSRWPLWFLIHGWVALLGAAAATAESSRGGAGVLAFGSPTYNVSEDGSSVTVTVQRSGGSSGAVSALILPSGGSATPGADYNPILAPVSWGPGDGTPKTFVVSVLNDTLTEGDETLHLSLGTPTGGAVLGSPATTIITIADDDAGPLAPCVQNLTTLCLFEDRFKITVDWRTSDGRFGQGVAIPLGNSGGQSGLFYFFNPFNIEMLVKMLNGCGLAPPLGPRYWVFYAATTNVEFTLRVTDTSTGVVKTYFNPLNRPAPPVQDTGAFASCP